MRYLFFIFILVGCGPYKPDYVDNDGKEYQIYSVCIKSHTEHKYGYHYGWNPFKNKYEYHFGGYTETICDEYDYDTVEINKKEKYYQINKNDKSR